jgi:hypothetical protein
MARADDRPRITPDGPENDSKADRLTPRQEAAALALARGCKLEKAAQESGAGQRTIKTWMASLPAFRRRNVELRSEMTFRALGRLVDNMASASETLGYLSRKGKSETVRLGAARAVLELGQKVRESVELEERIAALEGQQIAPGRRIA